MNNHPHIHNHNRIDHEKMIDLKGKIDEYLETAEGIITNLLPRSYPLKERIKIAKLCVPLIGFCVANIIREIKKDLFDTGTKVDNFKGEGF